MEINMSRVVTRRTEDAQIGKKTPPRAEIERRRKDGPQVSDADTAKSIESQRSIALRSTMVWVPRSLQVGSRDRYKTEEGLKGGGALDGLIRKLDRKESGKRSVFVTYSWAQKEIAKKVERVFQEKGYMVIRDENELNVGANLKDFMKLINHPNLDYVIPIVSKQYMESENCMYEVGQVMGRHDWENRMYPIVMCDVEGTRADLYKGTGTYEEYWESKESQAIGSKKEAIVEIIKNAKAFGSVIGATLQQSESAYEEEGYKTLFDQIEAYELESGVIGRIIRELRSLIDEAAASENMYEVEEAKESYEKGIKVVKENRREIGKHNETVGELFHKYGNLLGEEGDEKGREKNEKIGRNFGYREKEPGTTAGAAAVSSAAAQPTAAEEVKGEERLYKELREKLGESYIGPEELEAMYGRGALEGNKIPKVPREYIEALEEKSEISAEGGKRIKETHILYLLPKNIKGKEVTINSWKEEMGTGENGFYNNDWYKDEEFANKGVKETKWVLMPKGMVVDTTDKTYEEQQAELEKHKGYQEASALEVVSEVMLSLKKSKGKERLYGAKWKTSGMGFEPYARTNTASSDGSRVIVGDFVSDGLSVRDVNGGLRDGSLGLAAVWRASGTAFDFE